MKKMKEALAKPADDKAPPPPADDKNAQKPADAKTPPPPPPNDKNAQKPADAKTPPPPPADDKTGQKPADAAALAAAEKKLAAKAKEVAAALTKKDNEAQEESRMGAAARNMFESSQALDLQDKDKAIQKAEMAIRELERLVIELKARSEDEFGRLLDAAERTARNMLKDQVSVRTKTETLSKTLGRAKPNAVQARTLKILASQQGQVNAGLEPFANILAQLRKISEGGLVRPGTAKQLEEADLQMTRGRVPQKAANATIELISGHPGNAVSEQQKAEEGLAKVLEAIRIANDARAAGYEAELKRAKGEADRIVEALARAEAGDASAPAMAVDEAQRLARHLQQRDLTQGDEQSRKDAALLGQLTADAIALEKTLQKAPKGSAFEQASARLQSRLDADYQALLAAKKLFSSQREECPPQYRQLVNQYFEALSTGSSKDAPKP